MLRLKVRHSLSLSPHVLNLLHRYGYPLAALIRHDLKTRYASTTFGMSWAVLQPLFFLLLYTVVFSVIMQIRFRPDDTTVGAALYLICGFLPYLAINESLHRGSTSLTANRNLLHKMVLPAEILPAAGVLSAAVNEIIGLGLLVIFALYFGVHFSGWLALLPLLVLLRIMLTLGMVWFVSVLNVFISDLGQLLGLLLTAWMFLTPIFYPAQMVPPGLVWLLSVNPLYFLIDTYRAVLLDARSPLPALPMLCVWACGTVCLGFWFFQRTIERAKDFV